jgi:predicted nucleic acid-binding protein
VDAPWLRVVPLRGRVHPIAAATLDAGEVAVIQLALESGIGCACIDDRRGRRSALSAHPPCARIDSTADLALEWYKTQA